MRQEAGGLVRSAPRLELQTGGAVGRQLDTAIHARFQLGELSANRPDTADDEAGVVAAKAEAVAHRDMSFFG